MSFLFLKKKPSNKELSTIEQQLASGASAGSTHESTDGGEPLDRALIAYKEIMDIRKAELEHYDHIIEQLDVGSRAILYACRFDKVTASDIISIKIEREELRLARRRIAELERMLIDSDIPPP